MPEIIKFKEWKKEIKKIGKITQELEKKMKGPYVSRKPRNPKKDEILKSLGLKYRVDGKLIIPGRER